MAKIENGLAQIGRLPTYVAVASILLGTYGAVAVITAVLWTVVRAVAS